MYIIFYQLCLQGSITIPGLHIKSFASKSSKGPLWRHSLHWQKGFFCLHIQTTSWDDLIYTGKRQHFVGFVVYHVCQMGFSHPPFFLPTQLNHLGLKSCLLASAQSKFFIGLTCKKINKLGLNVFGICVKMDNVFSDFLQGLQHAKSQVLSGLLLDSPTLITQLQPLDKTHTLILQSQFLLLAAYGVLRMKDKGVLHLRQETHWQMGYLQ